MAEEDTIHSGNKAGQTEAGDFFFIFSLRDLSCSILKRVPSLTVHSFQLGTLEGKKKTTAFTVTLVLPLWLQPKMNSNGSPPDLGGISEG